MRFTSSSVSAAHTCCFSFGQQPHAGSVLSHLDASHSLACHSPHLDSATNTACPRIGGWHQPVPTQAQPVALCDSNQELLLTEAQSLGGGEGTPSENCGTATHSLLCW